MIFEELLVIHYKAKSLLQRCNVSEETEREEGINSNIEGTDTTDGSECDKVVEGDGKEETYLAANEGDKVATVYIIDGLYYGCGRDFSSYKEVDKCYYKGKVFCKGR